MIDRRSFSRIVVGLLAAPFVARGQPGEKLRRVGVLCPGDGSPPIEERVQELLNPLRQLGWIEGRNIVFEPRFTCLEEDRLPAAAEEMVRRKVDLIFTNGTSATLAAKHATTTIPILTAGAGDPVGAGLVASLNHPGGNVTGYSIVGPDMATARAGLVHELLPAARRVAKIVPPKGIVSIADAARKWTDAAYRALGIQPIFIEVADSTNLNALGEAVREAVRQQAQALEIDTAGIDWTGKRGVTVVEAALGYRLPTVLSVDAEDMGAMLDAGALLNLMSNKEDRVRRVAAMMDKILRGAKPADIPIEQPTRYMLAINQKAAKALGITVPQSVLLRADEVIR
jgi:putative ABC transport system substrate-binding protein